MIRWEDKGDKGITLITLITRFKGMFVYERTETRPLLMLCERDFSATKGIERTSSGRKKRLELLRIKTRNGICME